MKYRVKTKDIQPKKYKKQIRFPKKCFLGISLSNPFFHGIHLLEVLKWIDLNFDECKIVIADHLHRFNAYIFNGSDNEEANKECDKMGGDIHNKIQDLLGNFDASKFAIKHWLDLSEQKNAIDNHNNIRSYFESNKNFKMSVINSSKKFIAKQINRGYQIHIPEDEAVKKSTDYILEELAVFAMLIDQGYSVQVYPGKQLKVLKDIANNHFPHFNTSLKNGIYIDLSIKKN